VVGVKKASKG